MNKKLIIIFLIILSLILSSCVFEELKISNTINSPRILKSPIQGEWVLEQYKEMPFIEREIKTNIIGEVAISKMIFLLLEIILVIKLVTALKMLKQKTIYYINTNYNQII